MTQHAKTVRILNNFATELLNVAPGGEQAYAFTNPRQGWVFIATTAEVPAAGGLRLSLGGAEGDLITHAPGQSGPIEAMRLLPAGEHRLVVHVSGGASLKSLAVRAIPEMLYCQFQANPHVSEYGPYDWAFLQKHVLPHCNTVIGSPAPDNRPYVEEWKRRGGRWIIACGVPGHQDAAVNVGEAEKYWGEHMTFHDGLADGVIADEFHAHDQDKYPAWTEALRRLQRDPRLAGKTFYPYCATLYEGQASRDFIQAVTDAGWRFAWERYLSEQPTLEEARAHLADRLSNTMQEWRTAQPGAAQHAVVCLGYFSAPPESLDILPTVNYQVWMDMQFNVLANDPAFAGLYGVMEYLSSYADEENVRWAARLYRHYCIEGKTAPLSRDPYLLPHLVNPDFESGLEGWQTQPAEPGSITAATVEGLSWIEGRYRRTNRGDTCVLMKRSARGPNLVSQIIRDLQPGRLYSLRMFSADRGDLSQQQKHALSLRIEGVELIPEKSFQHVFHNCYSHHFGPYDAEHYAWMNYHWRVFRATGPQARLTISDWAGKDDPGGPIGQELVCNFVQVQPYLEQ